jgi:hypothetical protein
MYNSDVAADTHYHGLLLFVLFWSSKVNRLDNLAGLSIANLMVVVSNSDGSHWVLDLRPSVYHHRFRRLLSLHEAIL